MLFQLGRAVLSSLSLWLNLCLHQDTLLVKNDDRSLSPTLGTAPVLKTQVTANRKRIICLLGT